MRIPLQAKLTLLFLICGLVPLLVATIYSFTIARRASEGLEALAYQALERRAEEQLEAVLQVKREHVRSYVEAIAREAKFTAGGQRLGLAFLMVRGALGRFLQDQASDDVRLGRKREELRRHYEEDYLAEYRARWGESPPDFEARFRLLDADAIAVQHAFFLDGGRAKGEPARIATGYGAWQAEFGPHFEAACNELGYHDLLLVDAASGAVVFSARQHIDFGTSLKTGPWADTKAGEAFRKAMELEGDVFFTDFAPYPPAYDAPVAFLAAPIRHEGAKPGAVILELTIDHINALMRSRAALGETGEMFLVGPDLLLRSDAVLDDTGGFTVARAFREPEQRRIDNEATRAIFAQGGQGVGIFRDYRDREVLMAYAPVDVLGVRWGLLVKMDVAEAFAGIHQFRRTALNAGEQIARSRFFLALLSSLAVLFLALSVTRPIVRPLRRTVAMLRDMAQGQTDLTHRLEARTRDEVADLAYWFNTFMERLQGVYEELAHKTLTLEKYQRELEEYSRNLEQEIIDRQWAEAEIQRREAYYKALIEHAPDVIVVVDREGVPQYMSPSFKAVFGYATDELRGKPLNDLVHPDDWAARDARRAEAVANPGVPVRTEFRARRKDGRWVWLESTGTSFLDDQVVAGIVLNLRDITARKEAEALLRDYSGRLELEVAERTAELRKKSEDLQRALEELHQTQDQLILNQKMASLGALTAGIAHEIKNPLNFINNFADLCVERATELAVEFERRRDELPEDLAAEMTEVLHDLSANAARIREHGGRADSIVRNMLLHSRGRPGQRQRTDLNNLLDEYVNLVYHGMRAKDAAFTVHIQRNYDGGLPDVEVVPQDIARVFLNVLTNACQAVQQRRREGGAGYRPRIEVGTRNQGRVVEIHIRDNGPGIPAELQDKVFGPFFTTKPAGEGTGLGLSISYDIIVRQHEGELLVDSVLGEYTEVLIRLPVRAGA
ncbi:MAG TPA: PAS domain S-box protein [Candidatus Hydrogenedentes bacterium]|nr:PAS domain S-box protein [Candidatus Hydrogenedentota bacterium]